MPKRTIVVDYHACNPELCEDGICQGTLVCDRKVLTQEAPYEMPDTRPSMCLSCASCTVECPTDALQLM